MSWEKSKKGIFFFFLMLFFLSTLLLLRKEAIAQEEGIDSGTLNLGGIDVKYRVYKIDIIDEFLKRKIREFKRLGYYIQEQNSPQTISIFATKASGGKMYYITIVKETKVAFEYEYDYGTNNEFLKFDISESEAKELEKKEEMIIISKKGTFFRIPQSGIILVQFVSGEGKEQLKKLATEHFKSKKWDEIKGEEVIKFLENYTENLNTPNPHLLGSIFLYLKGEIQKAKEEYEKAKKIYETKQKSKEYIGRLKEVFKDMLIFEKGNELIFVYAKSIDEFPKEFSTGIKDYMKDIKSIFVQMKVYGIMQ